jgi:hypothetical protein
VKVLYSKVEIFKPQILGKKLKCHCCFYGCENGALALKKGHFEDVSEQGSEENI